MQNKNKVILDLAGGTGAWAKPYKDAGYRVMTLTLPDNDITKWTKGDMPEVARLIQNKEIYGILAAPPCPQFSFAKTTGKPRNLKEGMKVVKACLYIIWECQYNLEGPYSKTTTLKFWALENPNGLLKRFLGNPAYQFDPYDFGDEYQKRTHLWGWFNEPKKNPIKLSDEQKKLHKTNSQPPAKYMKFDRLKTKEIHPEMYGKLTRTERRAITPKGFAEAFFKANR